MICRITLPQAGLGMQSGWQKGIMLVGKEEKKC